MSSVYKKSSSDDLFGTASFGGGGGGGDGGGDGGGWSTSTQTGDSRDVNYVEKVGCGALAGAAGGITQSLTGSPAAAGGATVGTYEACVGSLSTSAGYDDMMVAP